MQIDCSCACARCRVVRRRAVGKAEESLGTLVDDPQPLAALSQLPLPARPPPCRRSTHEADRAVGTILKSRHTRRGSGKSRHVAGHETRTRIKRVDTCRKLSQKGFALTTCSTSRNIVPHPRTLNVEKKTEY